MTDPTHPDDLRRAADLCSDALTPYADQDWSAPAHGLEWSCQKTLLHMNGALFSYLTHLGGRWQEPTPFRIGTIVERSDGSEARPATLLAAMRTLASVLAIVAEAAPDDTRAYHSAGMADPSGFLAMGCDELLIHTDDIVRSFSGDFRPRDDLTSRLLARLFPWSPSDTDPWQTLRWANGRADLPGHPHRGPDWIWHCAPLAEWDGTTPRYAEPA